MVKATFSNDRTQLEAKLTAAPRIVDEGEPTNISGTNTTNLLNLLVQDIDGTQWATESLVGRSDSSLSLYHIRGRRKRQVPNARFQAIHDIVHREQCFRN